MLLPGLARASTSCDMLKAKLGERIEAGGVRGYSLEAVPSRTPTPPGAKVIGTCEGGAMKMLYRRFGGTSAAASAAAEAAPAASAVTSVQSSSPQKAASEAQAKATAMAPPKASAAKPALQAVPVSKAASATKLVTAPTTAAVQAVTTATAMPASSIAMAASVQPPIRLASETAKPAGSNETLAAQPSRFVSGPWRWIAALTALSLLVLLWAWRAHRSAYDEAGLPRGPKLTV